MSETSDTQIGAGGGARKFAQRAIATVAVLGLLAWVVWRAWQDAGEVDWGGLQLRPELLVAAVLLPVAAFAVQGLAWVVMMRGLGYRLGWLAGVRAYLLSLLGNYIPGKVFIMVIRAQVAREQGLPGLPVAASVVLETLLRIVVGAVLAAGMLHWMGLGQIYLGGLIALVLVAGVIAHPRVFHALGNWALRKMGREPMPKAIGATDLAIVMIGYVGFWALYVVGFCLLVEGIMGDEVRSVAGMGVAFIASQISSNLAFFAPVGLGVSDATLAEGLRLAGAVGAAGVVAVVARVWRTACELIAIGCGYAMGARVARGDDGSATSPD